MDNLCLFVAVLSFLFLSSLFPCLCRRTFSFSFCSCLRIVVAVFRHVFVSQSPIVTCHGDLCLCLFVTFYFFGVILCLFVVVLISCGSFFFMCIFLFLFTFFLNRLVAVFFIHLSESPSFCALLFLCLSLRYYTICWAMLTLCGL